MTPRIAAIMPCRGRPEQTARNVQRLLTTAGDIDWSLVLIGTRPDLEPLAALSNLPRVTLIAFPGDRLTYWQAMAQGTQHTDMPLICNLANDLLPGQHWLARALAAYDATFGAGAGLLGLNDGHHQVEHSPHFVISRALLDRYGGWPTWYDHNFGDTELCQRATEDGCYAKAPWAVLYHDHPYFGGDDDAVYADGRAQAMRDGRLFAERRRAGWPRIG